jgi:hypothetical protein
VTSALPVDEWLRAADHHLQHPAHTMVLYTAADGRRHMACVGCDFDTRVIPNAQPGRA